MNKKVNNFLNSKGFNMFSALVAGVLLMSGIVLINMLVSTESSIGTEVYLMTNNFNLSNAAAVARSDALQSFNYNFRETLEDYLTIDDEELSRGITFNLIKTEDLDTANAWDKIKQNFEEGILKKGTTTRNDDGDEVTRESFDAVIELAARKTIDQFHDGRYGRYHVSLSDRSREAKETMRDSMSRSVRAAEGEVEFLQIVGCNEGEYVGECPIGTFYFIIPLDKMTDRDYENMPRIVVKDLISGEEIKTPILPRSRLNIYIPLRFFKAIFETQKNALALKNFEEYIYENSRDDAASLGYCDNYGCMPRTNPLNEATDTEWDKVCRNNSSSSAIRQDLSPSYLGVNYYPILTNSIGSTALRAFARERICSFGSYEYNGYVSDDPLFVNDSFVNTGLAADITGINAINNCPFNKIIGIVKTNQTREVQGVTGTHLHCSTLKQVEASALYIDTNPKYIVSGTQNRYRIGVTSEEFDVISGISGTCVSGTTSCKPE